MNIAIEEPPSGDGSVSIYTVELLRAMRRIAPQHTYTLLKQPHRDAFRTDRRILWEQGLLPRRLRVIRPDLYHAPYGAPPLPVLSGCPVVATAHDFIMRRDVPRLRLPGKVYGRYFAWAIAQATHVITDSNFTGQEAQRFSACPPDRVTTVLLGVDHTAFRPLPTVVLQNVRARLNLPSDFILFVGTLEPRKGTDVLLQAFARVSVHYPDLKLVLTGFDRWEQTTYYSAAQAMHIIDRIQHLGYISRADLPSLMNLAQVFVFPSRLEGFGLPVLEAMACGTPVVSSNAASLPEVAGEACVLVPPDDADALAAAVTEVLADPARRAELRRAGLHRAAGFTWEATASRTLEVYERVLASHRISHSSRKGQ